MNFKNKLISGLLVKRYKRFFVDIKIKNQVITAHCPNTGSMNGLLDDGNVVYLLKNNNPKRKLWNIYSIMSMMFFNFFQTIFESFIRLLSCKVPRISMIWRGK